MLFKAYKFSLARNIVIIPNFDENGFPMPYVKAGEEHYVTFGKVTKVANKKGSVKTNHTWIGGKNDGEVVYAIPVEKDGYSMTNMLYGKDGKIYLAKDGTCYTTKSNKLLMREQKLLVT